MRFFRTDLFRSFAIGFLIGTAGLVAVHAGDAKAAIEATRAP